MRWFSPAALGRLTAKRRTWIPAMVPWRAADDGFVTDDVIEWYARFAEGRPGVLVVEATGIRDVPSGPLLRIGDDRFVPGLTRLVDAVREASGGETLLFIQCIDFLAVRRRPPKEKFFRRYLELNDPLLATLAAQGITGDEETIRTALLAMNDEALRAVLSARDFDSYARGYRERVTDIDLPHVRELPNTLPDLFARAAVRAQRAGFHGVELHYAHAYTMASFLSALNTRGDGYGGPRESRARLPLEVFSKVRAAVGDDYCVGARFLGDDVIEGGSDLEDATYFGRAFARAGFDFLSISKGGKFEDAKQPRVGDAVYPYTGPSGHECMPTVKIDARGPFGRNVPLAATIRAAIREDGLTTPIVTAGGIASPWQAEEILERGDADFVGAARQSLCDPDWFEKTRTGRGDQVRRCFFTNYCEALDQKHKEVTCQRWDRLARPEGGAKSKDGKRFLLAPR